ncbi:MAG: molybdenum cofactor guanylyltransferase [Syntrophaceae bacterium]|nr:molybdenum cofactor guanylyltransferase [Syntrophaceae bacterium]
MFGSGAVVGRPWSMRAARGKTVKEEASMNQDNHHDITGVILVGGKSRRMGRDKAFLQIAGKTLFERVLEIFRESFNRLLLVGDRAERFAGYGLPVLPDIYPGSALGGLYTALYHAETEYIFVSSCDLPFPNREILRYLCSLRDGFDAVVPKTAHGFEPLFALYAKSCLGPMRELLESGNFCAYGYYSQVRVRYVKGEELALLDRDGRSFVNVNTPEEFNKIRKESSL